MAVFNGTPGNDNSWPTIAVDTGAGSDTLYGNEGNDKLQGYGGTDWLYGGGGNDLLYGDNAPGLATADLGDYLFGGDGNDSLFGQDGDDYLDGGTGTNILKGGDGLDTAYYFAATEAVTVDLAAGTGQVGSSAADTLISIENVDGSNFADTISGAADPNRLRGYGGADLLAGGGNDDDLAGDAGNDRLFGGSDNDTLYGGADNDRLFGETGEDFLFGGDGNDRLNGGAGADVMEGGLGNDHYVVAHPGDVIQGEIGYSLGGGIDTVEAWISWTLGTNLEVLRLQGSANLNGSGGAAPESLVGNIGHNTLSGGAGNDTLNGKAGNDILIGGFGRDVLVGESGADTFKFNSISDSYPGAGNRDFLNGFVHGVDRIDLSAIDADPFFSGDQAFEFIGSAAFSGAGPVSGGQLRFFTFGGNNLNIVEADWNGDGIADMQIFVNLTNFMTAGDFIL